MNIIYIKKIIVIREQPATNIASWFHVVEVFLPVIITIALAWYTGKRFFSDFKKQKRIENLLNNTKETLSIVRNTEEIIIELYPLLNNNNDDNIHRPIQSKLLINLGLLNDNLLLINKNEDLIEHKQITFFIQFIAELEKVLLHKYENHINAFVSIDFLSNLIDLNNPTYSPLEELRQELLKIYEMQKN